MDGKVLTKETKNLIVKVADDLAKLPFYIEPFDGHAFRVIVNFVDSKADKYVPDEIDPLINRSVKNAIAGNYEAASEEIGTAINKVFDIPLLDEDSEQKMFVEGVLFLLRMIDNWIERKKKKEI